MKVLSLRFGENFAPPCGTIEAHQKIINKNGAVWYGKLGNTVSDKKIDELLDQIDPKLLLIKSGTSNRFWAHVDKIQKTKPNPKLVPEYYRDMMEQIKCWFRITQIESAPKDIMSYCTVISSGFPLSEASKASMNPCIFVRCNKQYF